MTSLVSPLTRVAKAGVSGADFTTLESAVAANTSKPTAAVVDGQIDTKNATQMTQLYTRAQVDTAVTGRTTPADVQTALNTRFQTQDASNFIVFQERATSLNTGNGYTQSQVDAAVSAVASTAATDTAAVASTAAANASSIAAAAASTYTKTQVDAIEASINTTAASTYATQSALATVAATTATNATNITATGVEVVILQNAVSINSAQGNTSASTLAGVVAGTQALSGVDVQGNLTTTGTAIIGSSLQAAEIMSTGHILCSSWGSFGSIPTSPVTGDFSCLSYLQQT